MSFVIVETERTVTVWSGKEGHLKVNAGFEGTRAGPALARSAVPRSVRSERCIVKIQETRSRKR